MLPGVHAITQGSILGRTGSASSLPAFKAATLNINIKGHARSPHRTAASARAPATRCAARSFCNAGALRRNPIETWTKAHYEWPILVGPTILGTIAVVNDPAAIRHVFVDNAANYRKDALQNAFLGLA